MKRNIGTIDKVARIAIAVLFSTHVIAGVLGIVLLIVAAVMVLTSFVSFCPLYLPFGFNTNHKK